MARQQSPSHRPNCPCHQLQYSAYLLVPHNYFRITSKRLLRLQIKPNHNQPNHRSSPHNHCYILHHFWISSNYGENPCLEEANRLNSLVDFARDDACPVAVRMNTVHKIVRVVN